ncbi:MAG: ribonuclease Y [Phoenicibacter congonensis]|uniref:Ribonuclease Y n=1 Tax=Phoenicibacter congonensis TaxID=1944646 RepID=A0AA43U5G7_9ACTN|nr:ribonuclease Y [Phoenicibacter congonensis]
MNALIIVGVAVLGILLGAIAFKILSNIVNKGAVNDIATLKKTAQNEADEIIKNARNSAENIKKEAKLAAKDKAIQYKQELEQENKERQRELRASENRINQREESLDKRSNALDSREQKLNNQASILDERENEIDEVLDELQGKLESVSNMTKEEARDYLLSSLKEDVTNDAATIIRDSESRCKAECDKNARRILSVAIQRLASEYTGTATVTTVQIPNDDIKGRIIGREGRNIRTFEQVTGTNLLIDDSPEVITISCADSVRRAIGVLTMENLVADGRIHPAKIEEYYEKASRTIGEKMREAAEKATFDTGIHDLRPELQATLGRLLYRTSYSQNVLQHSVEVAHIAGMLASELGLDPYQAKRAGLLHDIGKAIDHESEGSHALIGGELCKKYGERPEIVHAIQAHHEDIEPNTVLDMLIQAADAVSASRPGARKESIENYAKRLERLEEIANAHPGVEKTYAMQAGREVRVMVDPGSVDDAHATVLAHDIAKEIEEETEYPGQVKVIVIRETRATDIAK